MAPEPGPPEALTERIRGDIEKWGASRPRPASAPSKALTGAQRIETSGYLCREETIALAEPASKGS
jgi:hypothetical protein